MGGFFGAISKRDIVLDVFFGTDYHSHLGTRRAGMAVYSREKGFDRAIHNIENAPFRTKFDKDFNEMEGVINKALEAAKAEGIHGKDTTPFLLAHIKDYTKGVSLASNLQLAYNNARTAARIAIEYSKL